MKSEIVNLEKVAYLNSLTDLQLKTVAYDANEVDADGKKKNWKGYCSQLRVLFRHVILGGKAEYRVRYKMCGNNRMYLDKMGGIQMLQRHIRGFLCEGVMTDYDMKNCHPTFAKYLCDKWGVNCDYLSMYCNNREKCWSTIYPELEGSELREAGKQSVLVAMNTDKVSGKGWIKEFSLEMTQIKTAILARETPQHSTNLKNPLSSRFNKVLCLYENELLQTAINDNNCCVPMFDGFLSQKVVDVAWLNGLGDKYGISWDIKEHSNRIQLPPQWSMNDKDTRYTEARREFEKQNVFINSPNGVLRISGDVWELNSIKEIISININLPKYPDDEGKLTKFIQLWLEDPDRRTCEKMTFCPYSKNPPKIPSNQFNTFIEFPEGDGVKTDFVSEYLLPLTLELCEGSSLLQQYLLNWIAHLIQYPEELPEVMIILKGREGNGKDTLGQIITRMIGSKYTHYTDKQGEVLGKFNSSAKEKLLITLNEGTDIDAMTYVEPMKHFFCARQISIKGECDKPYMANNYARGIMNSNNVRPIQVTDTNRRFFVVRTRDTYLGNKKWFGELYGELEREGVSQTIFNWFYNRDISEFKVRDFPKGSLEQLLKESTVKPISRFIYEAMTRPIDGWGHNPKNHNELWVQKTKIIEDLKMFCIREGYHCKMTSQRMKLELMDLSQSIKEGLRTINGDRVKSYIFDQKQVLSDVLKSNSALTEDNDPDADIEADVIHICGIEKDEL